MNLNQKWTLRGLVAAALLLALVLGWERVRAPERVGDVPYVPTRPEVVTRMLELGGVAADDFVFDLGSGDGRIVIRAAKDYGARARGFELDPLLVRESRARASAAGVADRVEFVEGNLFDADLSEATVLTLYLLPTVNLSLRARLFAELAPGTPVISQTFDMAEWRPDGQEVMPLDPPADLYVWTIPAGVGGVWDLQWVDPDEGSGGRSGSTRSAASSVARFASGAPVVRLLQRFQELEGELWLGSRSVPVTGVVDGTAVTLETTRDHPQLGGLRLMGAVDGERFEGRVAPAAEHVAPTDAPLPTRRSFRGRRRPADIEGVWDVGTVADPFVTRWSMRLLRTGSRWTATRWNVNTGATDSVVPLPGTPPATAPVSERKMTDLYILGSSISFVVGADAGGGSARRVVYHGLVEHDRISGMIHEGGELVPWMAVRRRGGS